MSAKPRALNRPQPQLSRREALAPVAHWTAYRKLMLLTAIRRNVVSRAEAMAAHGIGGEELASWALGFDTFGLEALKARTRLKSLNEACLQRGSE